jgi:MFS family permease
MNASSKIRHLFYSAFLFGLACGISLALTPLLIEGEFGKSALGPLATANALGIVAFALPAAWLAKHVSPKNALVTVLAAYALFDGGLPFVHGEIAVATVRFFDGACSVGVWICSETLLLAQTRLNERDKANLTSQYAVWLASGYVGGSILANVTNPLGGALVAYPISGAIALAGAVYVAFFIHVPHATTHAAGLADEAIATAGNGAEAALPDAVVAAEMSLPTLLGRIRCSAFAAFAYGYFQVAVVTFLPIYLLESKGIAKDKVTLLPGIFCLGMLLVSNPVGRLADRYGHLLVMRLLAAIGMCMVLGFVALSDWRAMHAAVFLAGASLAAMSPIALALVGFVVPAHQYSRANGIYNLFYASGIFLGPLVSGWIFTRFGGPAMLEHLTALWALFAVFAWVNAGDDPAHARRALAREADRSKVLL